LRCRAKGESVAVRRAAGRLMQMCWPVTAKLLISSVVVVLGMNSDPVSTDRRCRLVVTLDTVWVVVMQLQSCSFIADCVEVDERNALWTTNKAGLSHSHQHGFGLMNAWRMVNTARVRCDSSINVFIICRLVLHQ